MGEFERAEQYFLQWEETRQHHRFYPRENYEIGYVYFQLGRKEEAGQIFSKEQQQLQGSTLTTYKPGNLFIKYHFEQFPIWLESVAQIFMPTSATSFFLPTYVLRAWYKN